jgi:DNA-binding NtrC family response regulator
VQEGSLPDFQVEGGLNKQLVFPIPTTESLDEAMNQFERELVIASLERHHFNLTKTADQLKLSRHALRYRMNRLGISTEALMEEDSHPASGKELSRI